MTSKNEVPYGNWASPITIESVASERREISSPRVHLALNKGFFVESRPSGGSTIVEIHDSKVRDILPPEFSVENRVYEYGGPLCDVACDGRIIFSSKDDTLRILDTETRHVSHLPTKEGFRYSTFSANSKSPWVLAVEEDHTSAAAADAKHYIAAINVTTGKVKRLVAGADFYHAPCFSLDGTRLAWLEWNHPDLPFNDAKLYTAKWDDNGTISDSRLIAGAENTSVAEPRWGVDGSLFFAQEVNDFRQLFRMSPGHVSPVHVTLDGLENVEFGQVDLIDGSRTYTAVTENKVFAIINSEGVHTPILIELDTLSWKKVAQAQNIVQVMLDAVVRLTDSSVLVVAQSATLAKALYMIDLEQPERSAVIRSASDKEDPQNFFSVPEPLYINAKRQPARSIRGFLWMPYNRGFDTKHGRLPPLIIDAHGGPTWMAGSGLNLKIQYFTSRGYAYVVLNYTGSTGYGKTYRDALFGNWGLIDAADAAECAENLASAGRVDAKAIGISGHSAGGYCVLQCLTLYPDVFAGGVCAAGVSNVNTLSESTHKLEFHYADVLLGCSGAGDEEKMALYRARSAIHRIDRIRSPLLMVHGELDTVVPIDQMREMAKELERKGADAKLVEVTGEGHMLDSPRAVKIWLQEEEAWWRKTLLRA